MTGKSLGGTLGSTSYDGSGLGGQSYNGYGNAASQRDAMYGQRPQKQQPSGMVTGGAYNNVENNRPSMPYSYQPTMDAPANYSYNGFGDPASQRQAMMANRPDKMPQQPAYPAAQMSRPDPIPQQMAQPVDSRMARQRDMAQAMRADPVQKNPFENPDFTQFGRDQGYSTMPVQNYQQSQYNQQQQYDPRQQSQYDSQYRFGNPAAKRESMMQNRPDKMPMQGGGAMQLQQGQQAQTAQAIRQQIMQQLPQPAQQAPRQARQRDRFRGPIPNQGA